MLADALDSIAQRAGFAGVVAVARGNRVEFGRAYGLANRASAMPNAIDTRFAIASGTKGLTAVTVVSLISDGVLSLSTPARSVLGADLPLIGDDVTVEHLLAHLPVMGSGDSGIYSTAADIAAFWHSLFVGMIVPARWVTEMVRPRSDVPSESMRYGLGFWLAPSGSAVILEGLDAGVSFRSVHDPASAITHTVISNTSYGAWPLSQHLDELLAKNQLI